MSANDVIEYSLKDRGKVLTARISIAGGTNQLGFYQRMLPRIAGGVINSLPGILSYFPTGSELFLEMTNLNPSEPVTTKRKRGQSKRKPRSPNIGKPKQPTSKGAAKKAKSST